MEFLHRSVLLNETVDALNVKPGGVYVDATLGGGGHSYEICRRLQHQGRLIGIDQDADAITAASARLSEFQDIVTIVRSNYENIETILREQNETSVDGIMLDLGVSSYQLDDAARGFTYRDEEAPLDMRMDVRQELTAAEIVNTWPEDQIKKILWDYGEERFAGNIARNICKVRAERPLATAGDLLAILRSSIPAKSQQTGGHPGKRTFQALRIACNRELEVLENSIDAMIRHLKPQGRLCIITFHSLEDRIVKSAFRTNERPCICPPDFPVCVCGRKSKGHVVTKKPILPSDEEMEENSRSKSAKLRVFERSDEDQR
ncbi:MAG: 16S rRNA (cytosine(1402)-N(4))-methyltransferase RsmH [Lachnospiraceae bacterium]|nr:16S rRNA (cytosine(1402)-N(4))-methyltransferase RsmH [Lachnospiraceae bacterium]